MSKLLPVGKIKKLFGNSGELLISFYSSNKINNIGEPFFVVIDELRVPVFVEQYRQKGGAGAVVSFSDLDTEKRASELIGKELFVEAAAANTADDRSGSASSANDEDDLYFEDLVGYSVDIAIVKEDGTPSSSKGIVVDFIDSDMNPLFILEVGGAEVYVPANEDMISGIDTVKRHLDIELPDGLLDLNL